MVRFSSIRVSATSQVCVSASPRGLITFDGALEQLWEDAIGSQLMEDTAQELLATPAAFPGPSCWGWAGREKNKESWALEYEFR